MKSSPKLDVQSLAISYGEHGMPRWQCDYAIYHVCFRLADSVPWCVRQRWIREREILITDAKQGGTELSAEQKIKLERLFSQQVAKYLDAGHGSCHLRRPEIANLVAAALNYFENIHYRLHAWSIMPNHVHVIVGPNFSIQNNKSLSGIIHSWKSYTAYRANQILNSTEPFWQPDAYTRIIRSQKEYNFQIQYTWENPDKAKLQDWPWRWKSKDTPHSKGD